MTKTVNMGFVAKNLWKEYALYTVDGRAIPNVIDGLKPSQRLFLIATEDLAKSSFDKVAGIAGSLARYGYNHGPDSATDAGVGMSQHWENNICLIQGRGSFGTRLVPHAAAPRYIYCKLHENFEKYIKDTQHAPRVNDPELNYPAFFVPVIPLLLTNGCVGIATGYACKIFPRSPKDVAQACLEYIKTGAVKNELVPSWPAFSGTVTDDGDRRFTMTGTFNRPSKTIVNITEIPVGYDREKYVVVLDELENKNIISGYDDNCGKEGFRFTVRLKRDAVMSDEQIIKTFKLRKTETENLTAISPEKRVKVYSSPAEIIAEFCDFRRPIIQKRIDFEISSAEERIRFMQVKAKFIELVLDDKITFKGRTKKDLSGDILSIEDAVKEDVDKILNSNILSLTKEMVEDLLKKIKKSQSELKYWKSTSVDVQFVQDIEGIL